MSAFRLTEGGVNKAVTPCVTDEVFAPQGTLNIVEIIDFETRDLIRPSGTFPKGEGKAITRKWRWAER